MPSAQNRAAVARDAAPRCIERPGGEKVAAAACSVLVAFPLSPPVSSTRSRSARRWRRSAMSGGSALDGRRCAAASSAPGSPRRHAGSMQRRRPLSPPERADRVRLSRHAPGVPLASSAESRGRVRAMALLGVSWQRCSSSRCGWRRRVARWFQPAWRTYLGPDAPRRLAWHVSMTRAAIYVRCSCCADLGPLVGSTRRQGDGSLMAGFTATPFYRSASCEPPAGAPIGADLCRAPADAWSRRAAGHRRNDAGPHRRRQHRRSITSTPLRYAARLGASFLGFLAFGADVRGDVARSRSVRHGRVGQNAGHAETSARASDRGRSASDPAALTPAGLRAPAAPRRLYLRQHEPTVQRNRWQQQRSCCCTVHSPRWPPFAVGTCRGRLRARRAEHRCGQSRQRAPGGHVRRHLQRHAMLGAQALIACCRRCSAAFDQRWVAATFAVAALAVGCTAAVAGAWRWWSDLAVVGAAASALVGPTLLSPGMSCSSAIARAGALLGHGVTRRGH